MPIVFLCKYPINNCFQSFIFRRHFLWQSKKLSNVEIYIQVSLIIRDRYVPSFVTINSKFEYKDCIFDLKTRTFTIFAAVNEIISSQNVRVVHILTGIRHLVWKSVSKTSPNQRPDNFFQNPKNNLLSENFLKRKLLNVANIICLPLEWMIRKRNVIKSIVPSINQIEFQCSKKAYFSC